MKKKAYIILRNIVAELSHTSLLVFLFISFGLWYVNKLSHNYSTEGEVAVTIRNDAGAEEGIVQPDYVLRCRIQGSGYQLLAFKWFPRRNRIDLNLNTLEITQTESGEKIITPSSLFEAVSGHLREVRLQSILTPGVEIETSPLVTRKVPVIGRVHASPAVRYMQTRPIRIRPDSLEIKTLDVVLDTLRGIFTEERYIEEATGSLSGRVPLVAVPGLIYPVDEVEYFVEIEEFTEVDVTLPLEVRNAPADLEPIVIPDRISLVLHVSRSYYGVASPDKIHAYIDYEDRKTNLSDRFRVYIEADEKVFVKEIRPYYAELIFEVK